MDNKTADPKVAKQKSAARKSTGTVRRGQTASVAASAAASKRSRAASSKKTGKSTAARNETMGTAQAAKRSAAKAASRVGTAARSSAEHVARKVESEAESAVDSAISSVHEQVDAGKSAASGYVGAFGRAFEAASDSLEKDGLGMPATYIRAAANGLNQASAEVDGFETQSVTQSVERYVRGNPMLTVAGLALAGFAFATIVGNTRRRR